MFLHRPIVTLSAAWPMVALAGLALRASMAGHPLANLEYAAWVFFGAMPPLIVWVLKHNQPDPSMSKVIYDAEQPRTPRPPTVSQ
jgi:hypothetical protein